MPNTAPNPSGDEPVVNSHSGDEPKPQGAFKTINYDQNTGAADVKVTPASKAAQAMAAGEPVRQRGESADGTASADAVDDMTVQELHQRASDLNIEGRSELTTKADLIKAIKKAQK
jgi:hypothetical protein